MFSRNAWTQSNVIAWVAVVSMGSVFGQVTSRVSVASDGTQGNGVSGTGVAFGSPDGPSISADGRYVAFASEANNFVPGDTSVSDIFVHDRQTGTTERVSVSSSGEAGSRHSVEPVISANGRYVAFSSAAENFAAGDPNGSLDVFVHDRMTQTTECMSVAPTGIPGAGESQKPAISPDGRYVVFASGAANLVAGDTNERWDVFIRDRQTGVTELVSVDSNGVQGNDQSGHTTTLVSRSSVSADGRFVAFWSSATNLVPDDTNGRADIFLRDRQLGLTERVNVSSGGGQANGDSILCAMSPDGRYVAFDSNADNLGGVDTNLTMDVFLRDRQLGTTERVTPGQTGGGSYSPFAIAANGRYVGFYSFSNNLVIGDMNNVPDAFVYDRQTGQFERLSVDSAGVEGNGWSGYPQGPSLSADGRYAAFASDASNLVSDDTNGFTDVFVRDRNSGVGWTYCIANSNSTGSPASISASGSASSSAGDLTLGASPVPNNFGLFFHGAAQGKTPFGNGWNCISGSFVRGAVIFASGNAATYTYDNSDIKHSLASFIGTTRNFQFWFRDPAAGGSRSNTSDAISIVILP